MGRKIQILHEDQDILIINKPSGLAVHPDGRSSDETISDWFESKYPESKNVGEPLKLKIKNEELVIKKPGIVHRLDKETSGVMILVKNQKSFLYFKNLFKEREIKKTYVAFVDGVFKNDKDTIDKPIGRSPLDFRRRLAGRGARGELRESVTDYKVIKNGDSENPISFLEIYPKTGRTHQIRVHMKYISRPVVCDKLYNPNGLCPVGLGRLALHAKAIEFKNQKGEIMKVEAPLPEEFEKMLALKNEGEE